MSPFGGKADMDHNLPPGQLLTQTDSDAALECETSGRSLEVVAYDEFEGTDEPGLDGCCARSGAPDPHILGGTEAHVCPALVRRQH